MQGIISRYKGLPREIYILFFARIINSIGAFVHPLPALIMTDKLGMSAKDADLFMTILLFTQLPVIATGGFAFGWITISAASLLGAVLLISFMNNRKIKQQINMIED